MLPHIERMKDEYRDLISRINGAKKFLLDGEMSDFQKETRLDLLQMQVRSMEEYSHILFDRIQLELQVESPQETLEEHEVTIEES